MRPKAASRRRRRCSKGTRGVSARPEGPCEIAHARVKIMTKLARLSSWDVIYALNMAIACAISYDPGPYINNQQGL